MGLGKSESSLRSDSVDSQYVDSPGPLRYLGKSESSLRSDSVDSQYVDSPGPAVAREVRILAALAILSTASNSVVPDRR